MSIYTCLKKAHKASNPILPLYSCSEERSSSSFMFKYWMLIMKFQINYLVFISSMRKSSFKLFVKVLISLIRWIFIIDHYHDARWISVHIQDLMSLPITTLNSIKNFKEEILWSRFQVDSFHKFIITKLTNNATRELSLSKG